MTSSITYPVIRSHFLSHQFSLFVFASFSHDFRATHGAPVGFFFFLRQNPLNSQMQFDCACLCRTVCFQMNSWENSVAFCPAHIAVSPLLLLRLLYFPAGPSFPFCLSLSSSFCISDWLFEPSMGPGAIVKHAFFLPKFCLCVLQPHWGLPSPLPVYSSFVASRKAFISHLFSLSPHHKLSLPSEKDRKWMQMSDPPEHIAHSLFRAHSFFFFLCRPPRLEKLLHHTLNTLTY